MTPPVSSARRKRFDIGDYRLGQLAPAAWPNNVAGLPSKRKIYVLPIIFSIGFVLLSPLGLFVIFLSGDSCCGQNTSGTMIAVTAGIVILLALIAVLLNTFLKLSFKRDTPDFTIPTASLITAGPASLIHIGFVAIVSATAF